jgi:hypothetical protein
MLTGNLTFRTGTKCDNWDVSMSVSDRLVVHPSPLLASIHVFARRDGTELFRYLGTGSMAGFGPTGPRGFLLHYRIVPKLRRDVWVSLGGYTDWLLTIGRSDFNVSSCRAGALLIESQWGRVSHYLRLTRYEGDILQAATNDQGQAVVSYLANSSSPELFSGNYDWTGPWVSFPYQNGDTWEVPFSTVIDRKDAVTIIETHLSTGRPIGINGVD